jgi:hypothetical protein
MAPLSTARQGLFATPVRADGKARQTRANVMGMHNPPDKFMEEIDRAGTLASFHAAPRFSGKRKAWHLNAPTEDNRPANSSPNLLHVLEMGRQFILDKNDNR